MRRVLLLTTLSALATACSSGSGEPPLPSNPEDAASVVAAARDCNVADFSDGPRVTTLQGEVDIDEAATASQRNSAASEAYLTQMASHPCVSPACCSSDITCPLISIPRPFWNQQS